ncbi:MAG TPA: sucrose phosphorylase [Steroidobacteraceae bacterium]|nr:sucrose phosphorylase [Steroidobacteraceae bacterium]
MKNQVQLICYADRLGGTLRGLRQLLAGPLSGLFGGVHLLPFFHPIDGSDAGFDPIDHTQVDERLGGWDDVRALSADVEIMSDVIVNHISSHSPQFLDFSAHGDSSRYHGLFLTLDNVFPEGASERDLLAIYRPRPGLPFTPMTLADGSRRILWTTFTAEQLDIDVRHPEGRRYLDAILRILAANGVRLIRLDAVGYAVKKAGASCFMMPETFAFIREFAARAKALSLEVLVEIHSHHQLQIHIAEQVDWVYDFALPPLVLHGFTSGTARYLKDWIAIRPTNCLTVLDTHDGIGVIDVGADAHDPGSMPGLVPNDGIDRLVRQIHANSSGDSLRATGAAASNLDLYQVNCTFFDALARDELRYLLCRAIQFFLPGIPQVYYVGLLAGVNDMALLARTGVGRDINRHHYTRGEIEEALSRPVVADLLSLIRLRNTHPAFQGIFELLPSAPEVLEMRWHNAGAEALLRVDLASADHSLNVSRSGTTLKFHILSVTQA